MESATDISVGEIRFLQPDSRTDELQAARINKKLKRKTNAFIFQILILLLFHRMPLSFFRYNQTFVLKLFRQEHHA